jgi:hypothetical protein
MWPAFLREFEGEVGGREATEITAETLRRIHGLAEGPADEKERAILVQELAKNPEWIGVLADEVKKRR